MSDETAREAVRPLSVEQALAVILRAAARGPAEDVPLADAAGRMLAGPITAAEDLWPFARAAMDGIAVRATDVSTASAEQPVRLRVWGAVYAGQAMEGALPTGTCVRVATGAPVPAGADAVIPQEALRVDGDSMLAFRPVSPGQHIFPAGEDVRAGERVMEPGTILRGGHLGLLASMGCARVPVIRRPTVAILTCGDELIGPAESLRPGQVRESNGYVLAAYVQALGAHATMLANARDIAHELDEAVLRGLQADVLITSGGLSVGERDLVRPALRCAGVVIEFESVAMKPGARVAFGRIGRRLVFGLPGTPSACRVAFEILVVPALRTLLGYREAIRPPVSAYLTAPVDIRPGRRRYLWGLAALSSDGLAVTPHLVQSTATLRAASDANALILIEAHVTALAAGSRVPVHLLDAEALPVTHARRPEVIGVVGERDAGKTTLIERLVPALAQRGVTVAVIKHHFHQRELDEEGTDTARAAAAGAVRTVLAGPGGVTSRAPSVNDPPLEDALAQTGAVDLVLVEGYSRAPIPKILVRGRSPELEKTPPSGPIIAVVSDAAEERNQAAFRWDQIDRLADFIVTLVR